MSLVVGVKRRNCMGIVMSAECHRSLIAIRRVAQCWASEKRVEGEGSKEGWRL